MMLINQYQKLKRIMKMKKITITITVLIALFGILSFSAIDSVSAFNDPVINVANEQESTSEELNQSEIDALLFMREEEKLARDVYLTLYEKWNLVIFNNIARSEQQHMDAVKVLLDQYNLEDPMLGEIGEFENQVLQDLYDELILTGSKSVQDALKVGGAIEEIDILDLKESLADATNTDVIRVFESLLRGSNNHLRAFVNNYNRQAGETYQPQYMSQVEFDEITNQSSGTGNGRFQSTLTNGRRGGRR
jgi:hypothetical protein